MKYRFTRHTTKLADEKLFHKFMIESPFYHVSPLFLTEESTYSGAFFGCVYNKETEIVFPVFEKFIYSAISMLLGAQASSSARGIS